jgi:serine/threonine-protein kinase
VSAGAHGASPATLRRFAREAKASSAVSSLNVARTVDAGCDDRLGFPYIVMELLHGVDLSTVMKREGALAPEVAVRLAVQAARGIAAAHSRGVVHRDIKPANLFLQDAPQSSEVVVKVCDFGVAKNISGMGLSSAAGRYSLTGSGGMLGSPLYMSPEQARSAKHVDERTDVWSLSVVLWEMLAGQRLWGGQRSLGELLVAICTEPVPRLETVAPWVPRELARAVHEGLARDLAQRTPTARALIDSLERFAGSSARVVMSQLVGLSEAQRGELSLGLSVSAPGTPSIRVPTGSIPVVGVGERARAKERSGSSKSAMVSVALLSAAVAGGAAYFLARGSGAPTAEAPAAPFVTARVAVVPAIAQVSTKQGTLSVVDGTTTLQGRAGETLQVTVQHEGSSKTFAVSLGSDGIASPSRLVLLP